MTSQTMRAKWYAWLTIFICSMLLFYRYILQVYPSIITQQLRFSFNIDAAQLGNLAAMFFYTYLVVQLFVGVLIDKFGMRYLTTIAILVGSMGAFAFALSHTFLQACVARSLMGIAAAFATVVYMKNAAIWFKPSQFAFVSGLLATATMLGAVFGEAPLSLLVSAVGWRHALIWCGVFGLVIAACFVVFIRDHQTDQVQQKSAHASWQMIWAVLTKKQNWLLMLYSGLAFAPVAAFAGLWATPFLRAADHLDVTKAAALVSLVFVGLAIGGPLMGFISDRLRNRKLLMYLGLIVSLISITAVIYLNMPIWLNSVLLFLFGFGTGAFMLGFVVAKEENPIAVAAVVIALVNTGDAIFGAISQPLLGFFLDLGWHHTFVGGVRHFTLRDFHISLLILPIYLIIALFFLFFVKEQRDIM